MNRRAGHHGLTLIEAVVSLVIISVMGVAALRALSAATLSRALAGDRARGVILAEDLMQEILAAPYGVPPNGEIVHPETRLTFDDIGDYHAWSSSPPTAPDGKALAPAGWRREVSVKTVQPADPAAEAAGTGLARIRVRVYKGDSLVASAQALRAEAWDTAVAEGGP